LEEEKAVKEVDEEEAVMEVDEEEAVMEVEEKEAVKELNVKQNVVVQYHWVRDAFWFLFGFTRVQKRKIQHH
jgi:hypothetical protein